MSGECEVHQFNRLGLHFNVTLFFMKNTLARKKPLQA